MTTTGAQTERFQIKVSGEPFRSGDPEPSGHGVLNLAGRRPVEEHLLLFRKKSGELEEIGLEETVNLEGDGIEEFFAFRADRFHYFVLDSRRFPWGEASFTTAKLRQIALVPANLDIWLERQDQPDLKLLEDATITLSGAGVERFYTKARELELVCVEIDGEEKRIPPGVYTTEMLKTALGVAQTLALDIIENGVLRALGDNEEITVVNKMKFVSHQRQGGSA